ncbi:hypothetical protein [Clostridium sp. VAP52]|uniref:hypothetical protein n=1 Tax=Clostridium sp. VAP52 TaxID=2949977 RepID=UPI002079FD10|nr:hypothetical protein [Clostridium sp. VAP52]
MTTYSPFELEPVFIDFKNESYNLGLDIQANQNDTLTLNFICRNNGIEEDMSKYKVELRVHNNNVNVDYIQTQNENVALGTDGSVKIVCQSLKGNKLTAYSGQLNGILRIFNTENKQKATRIITMRIIADPLETDRANICESTITKLEELDWLLNEAYNIEDEFKKAIEEAIKVKNELIKTTNEAKSVNTTLEGNIKTGTTLNTTLVENTNEAKTTNEVLVKNTSIADEKIKTLNEINTTADKNIADLTKQNDDSTKNITDLTKQNNDAIKNKAELGQVIINASDKITEVETSIINADKSKEALDLSKTNGDAINKEINDAIVVAKESIEEIKHLDTTHIVQDVGDIKEEVKEARGEFPNLNDRITEAENSGGFFMSETLPEIADRKSTILYKKILNRRDV